MWRSSHLYNTNPHGWKDGLYIETWLWSTNLTLCQDTWNIRLLWLLLQVDRASGTYRGVSWELLAGHEMFLAHQRHSQHHHPSSLQSLCHGMQLGSSLHLRWQLCLLQTCRSIKVSFCFSIFADIWDSGMAFVFAPQLLKAPGYCCSLSSHSGDRASGRSGGGPDRQALLALSCLQWIFLGLLPEAGFGPLGCLLLSVRVSMCASIMSLFMRYLITGSS